MRNYVFRNDLTLSHRDSQLLKRKSVLTLIKTSKPVSNNQSARKKLVVNLIKLFKESHNRGVPAKKKLNSFKLTQDSLKNLIELIELLVGSIQSAKNQTFLETSIQAMKL